jgi:diacylglycerol kinase (ATP)
VSFKAIEMESSGNNEALSKSDGGLPGSFRNAFSGIAALVRSERNARIHIGVLVLVIIAGIALKISPAHWIAVSLAAGFVIAAECINTAIECLCNSMKHEYDPGIKRAKDLAAAGVLVSAVTAVVIGLIVFIPALLRILE